MTQDDTAAEARFLIVHHLGAALADAWRQLDTRRTRAASTGLGANDSTLSLSGEHRRDGEPSAPTGHVDQ